MTDATTIVGEAVATETPADVADVVADATKTVDATVKTEDAGKTIVDDKAEAAPLVTGDKFPDNWRKLLAGDDKAALNVLDRMSSPKAIFDSYREAQKKLSEKKTTLSRPGEDATPEQIKEWREANDIPEAPEKYEPKLRDNRVLGEADKPLADDFAKAMHEVGLSQSQYSRALDWYMDFNEGQQSEIMERDLEDRQNGTLALKEEWGNADYARNVGAIAGLFTSAVDKIEGDDGKEMDLMTAFLSARLPNGRRLGNEPKALRFLSQLGHDLVPLDAQIPPGATEGSVTSRLEEIRAFRRSNMEGYNADKKMQAEEQRLIEIQLRQDARRGKAA